jgi:hypothetical protein
MNSLQKLSGDDYVNVEHVEEACVRMRRDDGRSARLTKCWKICGGMSS